MSQSPLRQTPSRSFEDGWRAINRLIREDGSWSGHERNVLLRNNGAGTFDNVSGTAGLDLDQDGRAFAVMDYDQDGDPDIVLKSRTGPQLHLLRNDSNDGNSAVSFRLVGLKSNRDAIGARVTLETEKGRQVKILQAGSGFLSQHSKDLHFGLGKGNRIRQVRIQWPSGLQQTLNDIPINHRIRVEEGNDSGQAEPFRARNHSASSPLEHGRKPSARPYTGTWLYDPYQAPDFTIKDLEGREHRLSWYRQQPVLINFWATWCSPCRGELKAFRDNLGALKTAGVTLLAVSVDEPKDAERVKTFVREQGLNFAVLMANEEMLGVYNVLNKYLFDKNQNLQVPTTFLLDGRGTVAKVYRGTVEPALILSDLQTVNVDQDGRLMRALPFSGKFYNPPPGRNYFQFGIAFSEKGFTRPAVTAFEKTIQIVPNLANAHYNLGTLYMKSNQPAAAESAFQRTLHLQGDYPEAHNNLGTLLAEKGKLPEAINHFQAALVLRPNYPDALNNLGHAYMQSGKLPEALEQFQKALALQPGFPEALNNLGILYGNQGDLKQARSYFERALQERLDYPEAANNLAMVYAETGLIDQAIRVLQRSLRTSRAFEATYLSLARIYIRTGKKEEGARLLRDLLRRNPNHREARKILRQLGL